MKNYRIILGTLIFLIADPSHLCIEKDLSTRSEPTWTLSTCWKAWWRCLWRSMSSGCTGGDRTGRGAWLRYLPCLCRELQRSLILSIFLSPVLKKIKDHMWNDPRSWSAIPCGCAVCGHRLLLRSSHLPAGVPLLAVLRRQAVWVGLDHLPFVRFLPRAEQSIVTIRERQVRSHI